MVYTATIHVPEWETELKKVIEVCRIANISINIEINNPNFNTIYRTIKPESCLEEVTELIYMTIANQKYTS